MPPSTLRAPGSPSLQPPLRRSSSGQRGPGYSAAAQLPPPMPPSWRTAAASSTRRSLPPDAAAPPPHAAGAALGSQPQPYPGSPSYPVTPLFQRGRVRGDRRPPFCFQGRGGRGSTTWGAFARCSSPEPPRGHKDY
ncbi:hypothetical protein NDU88_001360 [Pleurodeles waltl]|uniref:Uncharacterized protein n=1 Tax=Pleurodeles waltl TaxID=8319 RepID=A0AAV7L987_PLEWA|nr:hypothetical protein NDU88_001360 [Pleurodeles waltl]